MKKIIIAALALSLLLPFTSQAASFQSAERLHLTIPISDDVYASGGSLTVGEAIAGDLFAAAGEVFINSSIEQDVNVVGGSFFLNGTVGDDLRIASGESVISGEIGDDVLAVSGRIVVNNDGVINGDLLVTGGEVILDGDILGNLMVQGGSVYLNGSVNGATKVVAGEVTLGGDASFTDVQYFNKNGEIDFTPFATGEVLYDVSLEKDFNSFENDFEKAFPAIIGGIVLLTILSAALIILLLVVATEKCFGEIAKKVTKYGWKHFGIGLAYLLITPVAAGILMATLIGLPLGLLILVGYGFSLLFAQPIVALTLTHLLAQKYNKKWNKTTLFFIALGIFIVLKAVDFMPFIGWLLNMALIALVFGALIERKKEVYLKVR